MKTLTKQLRITLVGLIAMETKIGLWNVSMSDLQTVTS